MWTLIYNSLRTVILSCVCVCALMSCSEKECNLVPAGQGKGWISVSLQGEQTRATTTVITKEEADLFLVKVMKGEEIISEQLLLGKLNTLFFPAGYGYKVFVENISEQDAESLNDGWGAKRYTGLSKSFGIQAGQTTKVGVSCSVANAAIAIRMADGLEGCKVTLIAGDRILSTTTEQTAYFNIQKDEQTTVNMKVEKDGRVIEQELTLTSSQVKDVNIKDDPIPEGSTIGLTISCDDTFERVDTEINIE